jgi:hypothetical protein
VQCSNVQVWASNSTHHFAIAITNAAEFLSSIDMVGEESLNNHGNSQVMSAELVDLWARLQPGPAITLLFVP